MARTLEAFRREVTVAGTARCFIAEIDPDAERCDGPIDAHHLVRAQTIRKRLGAESPLLTDTRIGVPICRLHHGQITGRFRVIPAGSVPVVAFEAAAEFDLVWALVAECP